MLFVKCSLINFNIDIENDLTNIKCCKESIILFIQILKYLFDSYIFMIHKFVDRKLELEFLEKRYRSNEAEMIVIYGRRRIGKTEIIKNFLKNKESVYILCTKDSIKENLEEFKRKFYKLTGKRYFLDLKTESFYDLFSYFVDEMGDKRFVLALDEFPYLIELDKGIASTFQKIWDELLSKTKIFLIICGSSIGLMETEVIGYKSPLYGRRTGEWRVTPLRFRYINEFFPSYDKESLVKVWCILGGTPFYLKQFDPNLDVDTNIKEKILTKGQILYNEPRVIMREEFREPRVYINVLKHISLGYTSIGKLSSATGLDKGNISKYLSVLEENDIVEHILPLGKRKRGIHIISDPYFNFWFRFVYPNLSELEIGNIEEVFSIISQEINTYYGMMFERLVFEILSNHELRLPINIQRVHKWWHKDREIDVIAVNYSNREIAFFEVKWKNLEYSEALKILKHLKETAQHVKWYNESRKEFYGIFSKSIKKKSMLRSKGYIIFDLRDL